MHLSEQNTFDTVFPVDRADVVAGAQSFGLGAGGSASAGTTGSTAGAGCALPRCAAVPDHHSVDESAGNPGCQCLVEANPGLTGAAVTDAAEKQGFDPAFIALVNFPTVVSMMADHIDDYAAIGQAFSADQDAVTASIQRLRAQAYDSGALRSSGQQRVEVQQQPAGQTIYVIQPANRRLSTCRSMTQRGLCSPRFRRDRRDTADQFQRRNRDWALLVDDQPWGWGGWGWNWGAAALTTIMDTGAVGGIPIVRYIAGTVRDQSSG